MKNKISSFVRIFNAITEYSGRTKIMYIHTTDISTHSGVIIKEEVIKKFGCNLRFHITSN